MHTDRHRYRMVTAFTICVHLRSSVVSVSFRQSIASLERTMNYQRLLAKISGFFF